MSPKKSANSTGADWVAVARDYAARELTVLEICTLHEISRSVLYRQIKRNGWPLRSAFKPRVDKMVSVSAPPPLSSQPGRKLSQAAMTRRLLTALDQKMTEFENRIAKPATSADSERDARTLGTLVRLFDKLTALGDKRSAARKKRRLRQGLRQQLRRKGCP